MRKPVKESVLSIGYLLTVALLGIVATSCRKETPPTPVVIDSPPPVLLASSPSPVSVATPPPYVPQVSPTTPNAQVPAVSDSQAVAAYLAQVQRFDAEREQRNLAAMKELGRRQMVTFQGGVNDPAAFAALQNKMREDVARDAQTAAKSQPVPACTDFARKYAAYLAQVATYTQAIDLSNPSPNLPPDGTAEKAEANAELERLLSAYPDAPRFTLN